MNTGNGLRFLHIGVLKRMRLTAIVLALAVVLFSTGTVWAQADETTPEGTYIVQHGDSWTSIAERNGLTVGELKAADPQSIRANDWLNLGEEINIPNGGADSPDNGDPDEVDSGGDAAEVTVHIVGGGESWNSIAICTTLPSLNSLLPIPRPCAMAKCFSVATNSLSLKMVQRGPTM